MGLVQEGIKVLLLGIIQFFLSTEGKNIYRLLKQPVKGTASNLAASACIIKSLNSWVYSPGVHVLVGPVILFLDCFISFMMEKSCSIIQRKFSFTNEPTL